MIRSRLLGLAVAISLLGFTAVPVQAAAPTTSPIPKLDRAPGLDQAVRLGPADPTRTLTVGVSLALRNQAGLESFIAQVSDRKSPSYGHYLTADQFAAGYGPTQAQVQQVVDYLRSRGLVVSAVSSNRTLVDATGSLAAVQSAFGVTISNWHDRAQNRDFYGNDTQPVLPTSLASYIVGVSGLNNHYPLQRLGPAPRTPPGGGPAGGYTPNDLKKAYDVTPLASAGYNGSGQALGLFELDGFQQSNITTYDTHYALGSPAPSVVKVDGGSGPLGGGEVEVELDIEVMHALAPASPITVWEGPNTDPGANDTYNAMVTSNTTKSNSTSWGICEQQTTSAEMTTLDNIFQQGAAQGQSFFAASGDYGAYDCGGSFLSVDSPANDPYVTGTGGTTLTLNADGTYKTESAWSNLNYSPPLGSGGGLSTYFARPSWQTGPGVSNSNSNGKRQVPDVSSDADFNTGYSVYVTIGGTGWTVVGGTSAAAPSWAAFTAVYNQYAAANGKPNLGYANPTLYSTGSNAQPYPPYHDVTTGNNLYYLATSNWDYATGWGSYDGNNFARDLTGGILSCPTGWSCADLGSPSPAGSQSLSSGTWTIQGGGADIWGTGDQFHFVWQSLAGDGGISARVVSQTNSNAWAKAGVMLRQSSDPNSAFYAALVTPGNGIVVHYRPSAGAMVVWPASLARSPPAYLQVGRVGSTFTTYSSNDGVSWTPIPGSTVTLGLGGTLLQGLAVTSHNSTALSTVSADSVSLSTTPPPPPPACPSGWSCADLGNATPTGSQSLSSGNWTIQGGGADIWGTSDQFHFVWQNLASDGGISARVVSQTMSNAWAKAGVMLRQSSNPNSAFYAAEVTPGHGIVVQYRPSAGATTLWPTSLAGTPPAYLQVGRVGSTFTAYTSNDGVTWTAVPGSTVTLSFSGALLQGLAVTSHNPADLSAVGVDSVKTS